MSPYAHTKLTIDHYATPFLATIQLSVVDILQPFQFAGLLFGAMLPYWFSAMTMKSVGMAALEMVSSDCSFVTLFLSCCFRVTL
jgi:Na+/H+-translocating membrane pyrophosphatase